MNKLEAQMEKLFSVTEKVSLEMENISLKLRILDLTMNSIDSQNNGIRKENQKSTDRIVTKVCICLYFLLIDEQILVDCYNFFTNKQSTFVFRMIRQILKVPTWRKFKLN